MNKNAVTHITNFKPLETTRFVVRFFKINYEYQSGLLTT